MSVAFFPLVRGKTTSVSPNVGSVMDDMNAGIYYVPEYQRDSEQWDLPKRSLFVESLINNLTIPPLIVYPEDDPSTGVERHQVIDGQQRLTTVHDYLQGRFTLGSEDEVEYAPNVGPVIQGKRYSELPRDIQDQIRRYTLNLIVLPKGLDLGLRLEIFRRINEAGVPLSSHDLRLATFGQSERVYFVRLAGVFDPSREGSARMIKSGIEKYGLAYPWADPTHWKGWWQGTAQAAGQAASQTFLYYLLARDLAAVETVLGSTQLQQSLGLRYDKTTATVLDLYCAQLQAEAAPGSARITADLGRLRTWFEAFESWFNTIKGRTVPRVPLNSSTKVAFFIAGAAAQWPSPAAVTEQQWEKIQLFLTKGPGEIQDKLGAEFSSTRGKWPGQKKQIEQTFEICHKIVTA